MVLPFRSGWQRLQAGAAVAVVVVFFFVLLQSRSAPSERSVPLPSHLWPADGKVNPEFSQLDLPRPKAGKFEASLRESENSQSQQSLIARYSDGENQSRREQTSGNEASAQRGTAQPRGSERAADAWEGARASASQASALRPPETEMLLDVCQRMQKSGAGLTADVRRVMRWVCRELGGPVPDELAAAGCNKSVVYLPIGRLGNLMGLYAIVFSYGRMYGTQGYVEPTMRATLSKYFPSISLPPTSRLTGQVHWEDISYQQAEQKLACRPGDAGAPPRYFRITNYPDRNGIDVFHPFYDELRGEFEFAPSLRRQAQEFLHHARGNRSSATYIGFHVRRTDYKRYIEKQYNSTLPDEEYFRRALAYYRERYADALFIVCSDDLASVAKQIRGDDVVIAGNRNIVDPGRDMALLSSCNHSVVTVGTYGFWGAYLAGGTVLVPERQTHLSRGDRGSPLLEIQLAGATNWVALRR